VIRTLPSMSHTCIFRSVLVTNIYYTHHVDVDSLQCTGRCTFRLDSCLNILLHITQGYERSNVCAHLCILNLLLVMKVLWHKSQWYRCSTVCVHWWTFRLLSLLNVLLHTLHRYVHSTVCISCCCFIALCSLNVPLRVSCFKEKRNYLHYYKCG
jgi:hypothetical protein